MKITPLYKFTNCDTKKYNHKKDLPLKTSPYNIVI